MLTIRLSVWWILRLNQSTQSEPFPGRNPQAAKPSYDTVCGKPAGDQYQRVPPGGTGQWQGLSTKGTSALGPPYLRYMVGFRKSTHSPQSRFTSICVFMGRGIRSLPQIIKEILRSLEPSSLIPKTTFLNSALLSIWKTTNLDMNIQTWHATKS